MISDNNDFGDYVCKATNPEGSLIRTISLQKGEKPAPPTKLELNGVNSSMFDLDVGASKFTKKNDLWDINGFRLEYMPLEQFKANGGKWENASVYNVGFDPRKFDFVTY